MRRRWMRGGSAAACVLLASVLGVSAGGAGETAEASEVPGCRVRLVSVDSAQIGTFRGECSWSVAPAFVAAILTDPPRLAASSSALKESRRLADGRILNIQKAGWPLDDRQSTLAVTDEARPGGGLRRSFRLAREQEPTAKGRVQVGVDEGTWEIGPTPDGGTRLLLTLRYEPGGGLPASLVHRMSPSHIARGLDELRIAAEALASEPSVASGPPSGR